MKKNLPSTLLDLPKEFTIPQPKAILDTIKKNRSSLLFFRDQPLEIIETICSQQPNIWQITYSGANAIHYATLNKDDRVLDFVIKKYQELSLDINATCTTSRKGSYFKSDNISIFVGDTALNMALKINNHAKLQKLIKAGASKINCLYKNYSGFIRPDFKCLNKQLILINYNYNKINQKEEIALNPNNDNELFSGNNQDGLIKVTLPTYLILTNNLEIAKELVNKNVIFLNDLKNDLDNFKKISDVIFNLNKNNDITSSASGFKIFCFLFNSYARLIFNSMLLFKSNKNHLLFSELYDHFDHLLNSGLKTIEFHRGHFDEVIDSLVMLFKEIQKDPEVIKKNNIVNPVARFKKQEKIIIHLLKKSNNNNAPLIFQQILEIGEINNLNLKAKQENKFKL